MTPKLTPEPEEICLQCDREESECICDSGTGDPNEMEHNQHGYGRWA